MHQRTAVAAAASSSARRGAILRGPTRTGRKAAGDASPHANRAASSNEQKMEIEPIPYLIIEHTPGFGKDGAFLVLAFHPAVRLRCIVRSVFATRSCNRSRGASTPEPHGGSFQVTRRDGFGIEFACVTTSRECRLSSAPGDRESQRGPAPSCSFQRDGVHNSRWFPIPAITTTPASGAWPGCNSKCSMKAAGSTMRPFRSACAW